MIYLLSYILLGIYFARVFDLMVHGWVDFESFNEGSATIISIAFWPIPVVYSLLYGQLTFKRFIAPITYFFKN